MMLEMIAGATYLAMATTSQASLHYVATPPAQYSQEDKKVSPLEQFVKIKSYDVNEDPEWQKSFDRLTLNILDGWRNIQTRDGLKNENGIVKRGEVSYIESLLFYSTVRRKNDPDTLYHTITRLTPSQKEMYNVFLEEGSAHATITNPGNLFDELEFKELIHKWIAARK